MHAHHSIWGQHAQFESTISPLPPLPLPLFCQLRQTAAPLRNLRRMLTALVQTALEQIGAAVAIAVVVRQGLWTFVGDWHWAPRQASGQGGPPGPGWRRTLAPA